MNYLFFKRNIQNTEHIQVSIFIFLGIQLSVKLSNADYAFQDYR